MSSKIQSVLFLKHGDYDTKEKQEEWLKRYNFKQMKNKKSRDAGRFVQYFINEPIKDAKYKTKKINKDVYVNIEQIKAGGPILSKCCNDDSNIKKPQKIDNIPDTASTNIVNDGSQPSVESNYSTRTEGQRMVSTQHVNHPTPEGIAESQRSTNQFNSRYLSARNLLPNAIPDDETIGEGKKRKCKKRIGKGKDDTEGFYSPELDTIFLHETPKANKNYVLNRTQDINNNMQRLHDARSGPSALERTIATEQARIVREQEMEQERLQRNREREQQREEIFRRRGPHSINFNDSEQLAYINAEERGERRRERERQEATQNAVQRNRNANTTRVNSLILGEGAISPSIKLLKMILKQEYNTTSLNKIINNPNDVMSLITKIRQEQKNHEKKTKQYSIFEDIIDHIKNAVQ